MRKSDLSPTQLRDLNVFNLVLECEGWADYKETEVRFDAGEMVNPEGFRVMHGPQAVLYARYHAPVNMISLR
ncbi:MAG: hypothetical protein AAF206_30095, partial [Bacteroidota bacterium]